MPLQNHLYGVVPHLPHDVGPEPGPNSKQLGQKKGLNDPNSGGRTLPKKKRHRIRKRLLMKVEFLR